MPDVIEDFFTHLGRQPRVPALSRATGSLMFDLDNGGSAEQWTVTADRGAVTVTRDGGTTDAVVHAPKDVFAQVVEGETNVLAAILRGTVTIEYRKDPEILVLIQRLFPWKGAGPTPGGQA
jgi:hypothetical protein